MATCTNVQEEIVSPLPRAPPPSPECPTHRDDITQFDFNALFISNSLKTSPISSREPSEPTSPSWNGSGNFNQSPFFYPSPEATPSCNTSEDHPTAITVPISRQDLAYSSNGSPFTSRGSRPLLSTSLPVNGDMDQLQAYYMQNNLERIAECGSEINEVPSITGKRRKISLKRQHSDDYNYYMPVTSEALGAEAISKKKMCAEIERERESLHYDVQSLSNSVTSKLSLQTALPQSQSFTVGSYPVQSSSHYLTNNPSSSASSLLPRHADSYPLASNGYFMAEGRQPKVPELVQPQVYVQQTIGFNTDDQMDCSDQTNIPISITRVDSAEISAMDTTNSSASINHAVMNNSFSFNLSSAPSSSFLSPSRPRTVSHGNFSSYSNNYRLGGVKDGLVFIHEPPSDGTHPLQHDVPSQFSKSL